MNRKHYFTHCFILQLALVHLAGADTLVISPGETVAKDFLIYQIGSNEPFTGGVVSTRYDGSKAYEEPYVSGKLHGTRTEWNRLGKQLSERNYVDGAMTGPETYWYANGQIMAVTNFKQGARHGLVTRWCENGRKRSEWSYVENMKDGVQSAWYADGQKRSEATYKNDKPRGPQISWHSNGQKRFDLSMDPSRQVITATNWYENGQKRCEASNTRGESSTTRTAWDENGNQLELDEQKNRTHCQSQFESTAPKPNESIVSVRSGPDGSTRYGTADGQTTATEIEVSESDREKMMSISRDARECGLPGEMSR
jgi:antitoxin component YwqK of YwqJK toxin-antitoxin module